jgi:hypothetical protein
MQKVREHLPPNRPGNGRLARHCNKQLRHGVGFNEDRTEPWAPPPSADLPVRCGGRPPYAEARSPLDAPQAGRPPPLAFGSLVRRILPA